MTVSTTTSVVSYAGNGVAMVYGYPFRIFSPADLVVVLRYSGGTVVALALGTNYSVSGVGQAGGGNVLLAAPPPVGATLVIRRVVQLTQQTDLRNQGSFQAETIEDAFDLATMQAQQVDAKASRALLVPEAVSVIDTNLPQPQPGAVLGWSANGLSIVNLAAGDGGGGDPPGTAAALIADHVSQTDPHVQYASVSSVGASIAAHEMAANPHPGYQSGIQFRDDGADLGAVATVTALNFTGGAVSATRSGGVVTVDITGGGEVTQIPIQSESGTTVTPTLGFLGHYVRCSNAAAITFELPDNASLAAPIESFMHIRQSGAGQVTIDPAAGVTVNTPSTRRTRVQHSVITVIKVGTDEWDLFGDLE